MIDQKNTFSNTNYIFSAILTKSNYSAQFCCWFVLIIAQWLYYCFLPFHVLTGALAFYVLTHVFNFRFKTNFSLTYVTMSYPKFHMFFANLLSCLDVRIPCSSFLFLFVISCCTVSSLSFFHDPTSSSNAFSSVCSGAIPEALSSAHFFLKYLLSSFLKWSSGIFSQLLSNELRVPSIRSHILPYNIYFFSYTSLLIAVNQAYNATNLFEK